MTPLNGSLEEVYKDLSHPYTMINGVQYHESKNYSYNRNTKTMTEYIVEDYAYALTLDDGTRDLCFYEVECTLNNDADAVPADELKVISYRTVTQLNTPNEVCFRTRDFVNDRVADSCSTGSWVGDIRFEPTVVKIDFVRAVELLHEADIIIPSSDKVTLRNPMNPDRDNPKWIFGSTKSEKMGQSYVKVDAVTGEVSYL